MNSLAPTYLTDSKGLKMFYRKLLTNLRNQNWFAAGVDFIIVVIGIFVALQVNKLNQEYKDRVDEKDYMHRLLDDAIYNEQQINDVIEAHKRRAKNAKRALDVLLDIDAQVKDQGNLVFQMQLAIDIASVKLFHGTYNELVSTGKLAILRDDKLKKLLQEEVATNRFVLGSLDNFRRLSTDTVRPAFKHEYYAVGDNGFSQLPTTYNFDTLRKDNEFVGAVQASIGAVLSFVEYRMIQLQSVQNLRLYLSCKLNDVGCETQE